MEADGIEATMVMLNSVLNSFSVAAKPEEGLSVFDYMLQNVSSSLFLDGKWVYSTFDIKVDIAIHTVNNVILSPRKWNGDGDWKNISGLLPSIVEIEI